MADGSIEALWGFIASEPDTKPTRDGKPRFFAFAGEPKYRDEPDGSRTRAGTEYRPMVAYGKIAEVLAERFARRDNFIATGYTRPYSYEKDGKPVEGQEFVVLGVGHDSARTAYAVDRSARREREARTKPAAARRRGREVPEEFTASRGSATASQAIAL